MSRTIDERVVSMQFDNTNFEKNVSTSMSTLEKLKQSLNLSGAAKGLQEVDAAANRMNFGVLGNAVETVRAKFSALEVMAVTALANITNSAVNAGKRLVAAFTIDPIKSGLEEYETQINAVQTILANTSSKGTTLDQVNNALDELNHYADMTIYNFTEMTRNIGTFTAAGVDLDTSVAAIKGIANLAAVSGSTSLQASTAMYQLSQALAAGKVQLMDWNSVVNAGMGGQVFQDALKETARVHGIAIDEMIEKRGSFRETLQEGWLSSQILTETLSKFTGDLTDEQLKSMGYTEEQVKEIQKLGQTANDAATKVKTFTQLMDTLKEAAQSGWTQTWEIIIGDFEEAKKLWTAVSDTFSDMINKSAESRNNMLQEWADLGGRSRLIVSLKNAFQALMSVITPIKEAFREVFPPMTAKQLLNLTERLRLFTSKLKLSSEEAAKVKSVFKGFFSVIGLGVDFIKAVAKGIGDLLSHFGGLGSKVLDTAGSFGDWLSKLKESVDKTNIFTNAVDKVTGVLGGAIDKVKEFAKAIGSRIKAPSLEGLVKIGKAIGNVIGKVAEAIGNLFSNGTAEGVVKTFNAAIFSGILLKLSGFLGGLKDLGGIKSGIADILGGVKDSLESLQNSLQAETLKKIATAIGILAVSLLILASIDPEKLTNGLAAMAGLFGELLGALAIFTKITSSGITGATKAIGLMVGMSIAVLILAAAMKTLESLDWNGIGKGLVAIGALMAEISIFLRTAKFDTKMKGTAIGIVILAAAMLILAKAVKSFGGMSWEEIGKGLASVGALLLEFSLFTRLAGDSKKMMSIGIGMVLIAASMKIFASAMKDIAGMSWEEIGKGLAGIAGALLVVAGATQLMPKNMVAKSIGLIAVGAALLIINKAVQSMAGMSWKEIGKGLAAMAGSLLAISLAMLLMPKDMIGKSIGLIVAAAAITILANALTNMSSMSWGEIAKGLVALGGSLAILAVALILMTGTLAGSAALIVAAGALAVLAPALKLLGSMSWKQLAISLIALAGAFAIFGVAAAILTPLIPSMLGISAAILLLGAGCLLAGVGITALAAGLAALAGAVVGAGASIVTTIVNLVKGVGELIVALCEAIVASAPAIAEALIALIKSGCKAILETIPTLVNTVLELILKVLQGLEKFIPQIADSLFNILISLMDKLSERMPELVTAGVKLISSFITSLSGALGGATNFADILASVDQLSEIFLSLSIAAFILSKIPITGALIAVANLAILIAGITAILIAMGGIAQIPGVDWLINEGSDLLGKVGTAIGTFVGNIVGGFAAGATSTLPEVGANLSGFMESIGGFITGLKGIDASTADAAASLASVILAITAGEVLSAVASWLTGGSSMTSFVEELVEFGKGIKQFADEVSGLDTSAVSAAAAAGKALAEMADTIPNEGGLVGWFAGENSMASFASGIVDFGKAIAGFSKEVSGIDTSAVSTAATAGRTLAEMADTIPNEGGVAAWFAGDNSMASFASGIVDFGKAIAGFSKEVSGINISSVKGAVSAGKTLAEMADKIPESTKLSYFGDQMKQFGTKMKKFASEIADIKTSDLTAKVDGMKQAVDSMKKIAENGTKSFADGFKNGQPKVLSAISDLIKAVENAVKSKGTSIRTSFENIAKSALDGIKGANLYSGFYNAGANLVDGFANGISANSYKAAAKSRAMANAALAAAKAALKIKSPSKVFEQVGRFVPEGFARGIEKFSGLVSGSAVSMADVAVQGTKNAIARITDAINSDVDTQPTIRPVLDLSGVATGAGAINGMFGMTPSVGLLSNVSAINTMMNRNQNGVNSDVIAAIRELGRNISEKSGGVYNINGITYDDGSNVSEAVRTLVRAARVERRV